MVTDSRKRQSDREEPSSRQYSQPHSHTHRQTHSYTHERWSGRSCLRGWRGRRREVIVFLGLPVMFCDARLRYFCVWDQWRSVGVWCGRGRGGAVERLMGCVLACVCVCVPICVFLSLYASICTCLSALFLFSSTQTKLIVQLPRGPFGSSGERWSTIGGRRFITDCVCVCRCVHFDLSIMLRETLSNTLCLTHSIPRSFFLRNMFPAFS